MSASLQTVVAIPVHNEEQHLASCLQALAAQSHPADAILLLLNNCTDASLEICHREREFNARLHIVECQLNRNEASAGEARRLAFAQAERLAPDGVILTTDADATVPATWIEDNLEELAHGRDGVCGMAIIDPADNLPADSLVTFPRLAFDDMRETLLLSLHDEIAAMVDPDPCDPWPRHQQNSGASIAVRADALRRAGGAPRIATGEDRALIARLALVDARIRHAPQIQVTVSGRLQGRAAGGMAATLARRHECQDRLTDDALEPTVDAYRRVLSRLRLRRIMAGQTPWQTLATDLLIAPEAMQAALQAPHFGQAWTRIQQTSAILQRRRVTFLDLARETRQALALRDHLRAAAAEFLPDALWAGLRHAL